MSIENRLQKNFKHLRKWAKRRGISAYRLYDKDIPEYPYLVDIYNEYAIVYLKLSKIDLEEKKKHHVDELLSGLDKLGFDEGKRYIKERKVQGDEFRYQKSSRSNHIEHVTENDLLFKVNLSDYIDTGLFLDHRPLRKILLEKDLKNKRVLNLFAYTCSLSVAAAKAGAYVTSVDMSQTYLGWGEENFALNELKVFEHNFINADCLKFIKEHKEKYDLMIIDPPTFSHSKKMEGTFDVGRDHPFILEACHRLLNYGGEIYFSNNQRDFKLETEYAFKDITKASIPEDFKDQKIHHLFYYQKDRS